jgi:hypothetical protein
LKDYHLILALVNLKFKIGQFYEFFNQNDHYDTLLNISKTHRIADTYFLGYYGFFISDYKILKELFFQQAKYFDKNISYEAIKLLLGDGLVINEII